VTLNGQQVTSYAIPADTTRAAAGHIGLQCHTGNVQFQNNHNTFVAGLGVSGCGTPIENALGMHVA
jgi:hypothetical protein